MNVLVEVRLVQLTIGVLEEEYTANESIVHDNILYFVSKTRKLTLPFACQASSPNAYPSNCHQISKDTETSACLNYTKYVFSTQSSKSKCLIRTWLHV